MPRVNPLDVLSQQSRRVYQELMEYQTILVRAYGDIGGWEPEPSADDTVPMPALVTVEPPTTDGQVPLAEGGSPGRTNASLDDAAVAYLIPTETDAWVDVRDALVCQAAMFLRKLWPRDVWRIVVRLACLHEHVPMRQSVTFPAGAHGSAYAAILRGCGFSGTRGRTMLGVLLALADLDGISPKELVTWGIAHQALTEADPSYLLHTLACCQYTNLELPHETAMWFIDRLQDGTHLPLAAARTVALTLWLKQDSAVQRALMACGSARGALCTALVGNLVEDARLLLVCAIYDTQVLALYLQRYGDLETMLRLSRRPADTWPSVRDAAAVRLVSRWAASQGLSVSAVFRDPAAACRLLLPAAENTTTGSPEDGGSTPGVLHSVWPALGEWAGTHSAHLQVYTPEVQSKRPR